MTTNNFRFYLQNRPIRTSQTGGQLYSDTSPFSVPCLSTPFQLVPVSIPFISPFILCIFINSVHSNYIPVNSKYCREQINESTETDVSSLAHHKNPINSPLQGRLLEPNSQHLIFFVTYEFPHLSVCPWQAFPS
jgi:hypothetical protein